MWLTHLIVGSRFIVVAHGDDGQHQVDEVKGAKKDDNHEEDDRVRPANGQHHVVNVLPIVESDQLKSGQHRPRKRVEIGVTKVGIIAQAGQTDVVARAVPVSTCQKRKKKKGRFEVAVAEVKVKEEEEEEKFKTYQVPVRLPHKRKLPVSSLSQFSSSRIHLM